MHMTRSKIPLRGRLKNAGFTLRRLFVSAAMAATFAAGVAQAVPPPAGTIIQNQASATYTDASGVAQTVTSNVVSTTVQQVASLTLTANGTAQSTANGTVYFPETLTNTGNGSDSFTLSQTNTGGFAMSNVQFYADNGSGTPIGSPITSTGALSSGGVFKFIVEGTVAATATAGQTNTITVTGTSVFNTTLKASVTDVTTVSTGAVISVTKSVSASSGAPGSGPYTYTLTYTNTGLSTATALALADAIPTGMTYVPGSARSSLNGSTALSDTGGTTGTGTSAVTSNYTSPSFTATVASVAAGASGTISFQVNVNTTAPPGVLNNTATFTYNNGTSTVSGSTNTEPFTVSSTASLTLTGQTVAGPAAPGSITSFQNTVTNTGTSTDTFNIKIVSNNFPSGTTFNIYKSDGVTPLVDTNGDGIPDTGPLAPGASYTVVVNATLPANATNAGAPYSLTKTATSVNNPSVSKSVNDTLTAVKAASVDVTDVAALGGTGVLGTGAGPEGSPVLTQSLNPGASTTFSEYVNNTGPNVDNYNLSASDAGAALPSGWTVAFEQPVGGSCTTTGAVITSTGNVAPAGNVLICETVSVPAIGTAGAVYNAGTYKIYSTALSPNSGATDTIDDGVAVNPIRSIVITPNGTGQTYPGGSYVYSHTITNQGNVTEGTGLSSIVVAPVNSQTGWSSTLYYDVNNSGTIASNDPQITGTPNSITPFSAGLTPGQSITVFDKVVSPSGATTGALNATTITVTTSNGSYTTTAPTPSVSTDSTTIISGNLQLTKAQALDATCAGPTGSTVYSQSPLQALPGACVLYQVTVTNVGAAAATNVIVSDATPAFSTLSSLAATTAGTITSKLTVGSTGTVSDTIGTLAPGASANLTFGVQINK
jgi:uncharacterized repeat protein (TIGR01451 family)